MHKSARECMRTRFELVIADRRPDADLRAASEAVFEEIERIEQQLSVFRADSELSQLNARAAHEAVKTDPRLIKLLQQASQLSAATDGAFDMAVAPLLLCWKTKDAGATGLQPYVDPCRLTSHTPRHGSANSRRPVAPIPTPEEIDAAKKLCGMAQQVLIDAENFTVGFAQAGVRLDPGAIGKGYAVDRAIGILRDAGIHSALLHGGTSTVYGLGAPPGEAAWKIALQHPLQKSARLAEVSLRDSALSVSAVHGRTFHAQGRKFGHIIDPRSGQPVGNSVLAAWVCPSATESDALSTALLVLGTEKFAALQAQFPQAGLLLACMKDGQLETLNGLLKIAN